MDKKMLLQMTADIVSAHASMNEISQEELLAEIGKVYGRLSSLSDGIEAEEAEAEAESEAPPTEDSAESSDAGDGDEE